MHCVHEVQHTTHTSERETRCNEKGGRILSECIPHAVVLHGMHFR